MALLGLQNVNSLRPVKILREVKESIDLSGVKNKPSGRDTFGFGTEEALSNGKMSLIDSYNLATKDTR